MKKLKAEVTRFFKHRKAALENLSGHGLASDDFFEVLVLLRYVQHQPSAPMHQTQTRRGRTVFRVAASPSPRWDTASYFEVAVLGSSAGLRTGLSVRDAAATVELDVVLVDLTRITSSKVPNDLVIGAVECKQLARSAQQPHANEVLGKAYRVFTCLPPGRIGKTGPEKYALASIRGFAPAALAALRAAGIGAIGDFSPGGEMDQHAGATVTAT